jgi:cytidyltransferase-like protein
MKRIFISGNFNVIHTGHLRLLKFAKECGDYLIVGVNSDLVAGPDAFLKQNVRIEALKLINFIDEILLIDCELGDIINEIKPDIVVKGKDFEDKFNIEKLWLSKTKCTFCHLFPKCSIQGSFII